MRSWQFRLRLAGLLASLAFIVAILVTYAYVAISYAQGLGLPSDRRQLAEVAAQLERAYPQRLGPWMEGRVSAQRGKSAGFPSLPGLPLGYRMPPASVAGV